MLVTESSSLHDNLEQKSIKEILIGINQEDQRVPLAVEKAIPAIEKLVEVVVAKMRQGGRLFYVGAGTSGRLGIVDASECPPTFGVPPYQVIGIIAGGDGAIRQAVEFAEDDTEQCWKDLQAYQVNSSDVVIGIAASGKTPYVIGGLQQCNSHQITTGCITCNPNSPLSQVAQYPIEVIVGPEFITGSTRMKAGTAQKLVLNMISTTTMIQLGRVKGNKMIDMQLTNQKLIARGIHILVEELAISPAQARALLEKYGNVRNAIQHFKQA